MAEAIVSSIAPNVFECCVGAIGKHLGYIWNYKKNIANLQTQVKRLEDERADKSHSVTVAEKSAHKIKNSVKSWQDETNKISKEAIHIISDYEERGKRRCLMGLCPNLVSRYEFSKRACKKQREIVEAIREAAEIREVSDPVVGQEKVTLSIEGCLTFDSRKSILEDIMKTLREKTKNSVGVYGLGGMGKTTLAKQIASQAAEENMFEEIVMATVTQYVDMKEIQGQIASMLDLRLEESSVAERASRIHKRLKGKKVLVILDDLWTKLDLRELGIPFGDKHMGCKVLLTSRSLRVLSSMGTRDEYVLGALKEDEAWRLFEEKVIHIVKNPIFLSIGKKVAKGCAGLPILIVTVAASLAKRPHLEAWNDALTQVKKTNNTEIHDIVKSAIKSISYECLEETHKRLFLLCGLLQGNVYIEDVLKYSLGWDFFGAEVVVTMEGARNRLHALIFDLKESCLLLDGNSSNHVKMHDVVRGVAISIARKDLNAFSVGDDDNDLPRWPENDVLKKCSAMVFFHCRNLHCFPERLECPSLELFILDGIYVDSKPKIPETLFERTSKLKVLDITAFCFPTLPSSLSFLNNLQSLHLDQCDGLQDISVIGELKKLQVLSLFGSTIQELPSSLGHLSELKLLDLNQCSQLKVIPAGLIAGLSQLEELHMSQSFNRWKVKECLDHGGSSNASFAELKCLANLSSLKVELRDANLLEEDTIFENWKRYEIIVGNMWDRSFREWFEILGIKTITALQLGTNNINHLQHVVHKLFKRTEGLCLGELKGINNVIPELNDDGFSDLKHLRIVKDSEIQFIVNVESIQHNVSFPVLESLHLSGLLKVEKMCNGPLMEGSFYNLKIVEVHRCNRLESLFSSSTNIGLPCLQGIQVSSCDILEEIVAKTRSEDDDDKVNRTRDGQREKIELAQLRKLTLRCLPKFITFFNSKKTHMIKRRQMLVTGEMESQEIISEEDESATSLPLFEEVSFPKLEELELSGISNLTEIWSHKLPEVAYCNLTRLTVTNCDNLNYIFTTSYTRVLVGLQQLTIKDCVGMKQVVAREGETETETVIFPQLSFVCPENMPNLIAFYSGSVEEMDTNENLEISIQQLFNEKVQFPSLKTLKIRELDGIKAIWPGTQSLKKVESKEILIFENLSEMKVDNCASLRYIFSSSVSPSLNQLKEVRVEDCGVETIIGDEEDAKFEKIDTGKVATIFIFPKLVTIKVKGLPKLECFYPREHTVEWPELKKLDVHNCDKISVLDILASGKQGDNLLLIAKVFSGLDHLCVRGRDMMRLYELLPPRLSLKRLAITEFNHESVTFPSRFLNLIHNQLEAFGVSDCSFQEIFPKEGEVTGHADGYVLLPQLTKLKLNKLLELKYIVCEQDQFSPLISNILDRLAVLYVRECPCLTNLVPPFVSFRLLKELRILNCGGLINLIQPSTAKSLKQLWYLKISGCEMIEEIIGEVRDDNEESSCCPEDDIIFNKLSYLSLEKLTRLTSFCSSHKYTFNFPALIHVEVVECRNMKTFCGGITITPKLSTVCLDGSMSEKRWEGELNMTVQQIFAETYQEVQTLAAAVPAISSGNQIQAKVTEPRNEGLIHKNGDIDELVNQDQVCENDTKTRKESDLSKGSGVGEEVVRGKEVDIGGKAIKPVKADDTCGIAQEQTIAGSGSSSSNSLQSNFQEPVICDHGMVGGGEEIEVCEEVLEPRNEGETRTHSEMSPCLATEVATGIDASDSHQKDFQGLPGAEDIVELTSEYFKNLQAREMKSISAEQVQFMGKQVNGFVSM